VPPDSVRYTWGLHAELFTFGKIQRRSAIIHRTVRCTPDSVRCPREERLRNSPASGICSAIIHRTCPVYTGLSGEAAEQRLLRANGHLQAHLMLARSAQKSGTRALAHRTLYSTCPVCHRTARRAQKSEAPTVESQRTGDVAGAPDCPVHHTTVSLHQTASLVVEAINTPNHLTFKSSKFSHFNYLQEL
jgi:hypothetical protein